MVGYDSVFQTRALLYHPRMQSWPDHFLGNPEGKIYGTTSVGRATSSRLRFNDNPLVLRHRAEEFAGGHWPG